MSAKSRTPLIKLAASLAMWVVSCHLKKSLLIAVSQIDLQVPERQLRSGYNFEISSLFVKI